MRNGKNGTNNRGSVAVLMALAAIVLLGVAALVIDVGHGLLTRAELQNVADAGSLAGDRALVEIYKTLGNVDLSTYTLTSSDQDYVAKRVDGIARQNKAAGVPIAIGPGDVIYGRWKDGVFNETTTGVNAISVIAHRDATRNGVVQTLLAGVLGINSLSVKADAAASGMSGLRQMPAGRGDIPVGISRAWFTARNSPCGSDATIRFYPTGDLVGCAGWHTFTDSPSSAARLRHILNKMTVNDFTTPETVADETYYDFTGGAVATDFPDMEQLYNSKKGADGKWIVHIPVYDKDDCSNPVSKIKIVGFATAEIYKVVPAPQKEIWAKVQCTIVSWGRGGGLDYGTMYGQTGVVIE